MAKGTDSGAKGPKASGPKATDSKASAPKAADAKASDGKGRDAKTDSSKSRASKAKAATATATASSSTKPSSAKPSSTAPSSAKPKVAKAKLAKAKLAKPKAESSKGKGSNAAGAKRAARLVKKIASYERQESKLAKELDKLHDRQSAARVRLSTLAPAPAAPDGPEMTAKPSSAGAEAERTAFCLREKRRVAVVDAQPTVLRNGRAAIAGVCASCGAKIVTLVAGPH